MVYHKQFIAVIKSNGKILREKDNNTVYIPYNTEYEILLKNLNSRDALVKITIDGEDVLNGSEIIIRSNSTGSLEGFLKGNKVTNKFKFIQKTEKIVNYRGDKLEDGIIRIEFKFAKIKPVTITTPVYYKESIFHPQGCQCDFCRPKPYTWTGFPYDSINSPKYGTSSTEKNIGSTKSIFTNSVFNSNVTTSISNPSSTMYYVDSDEGITVKGSESNQNFINSFISDLEDESHVIILNLKGCLKDQPIQKPLTVETKLKCSTCGTKNKSRNRYCSDCGTALF